MGVTYRYFRDTGNVASVFIREKFSENTNYDYGLSEVTRFLKPESARAKLIAEWADRAIRAAEKAAARDRERRAARGKAGTR